jgi:hypothetical protein
MNKYNGNQDITVITNQTSGNKGNKLIKKKKKKSAQLCANRLCPTHHEMNTMAFTPSSLTGLD